jgi:hypothetical protein
VGNLVSFVSWIELVTTLPPSISPVYLWDNPPNQGRHGASWNADRRIVKLNKRHHGATPIPFYCEAWASKSNIRQKDLRRYSVVGNSELCYFWIGLLETPFAVQKSFQDSRSSRRERKKLWPLEKQFNVWRPYESKYSTAIKI